MPMLSLLGKADLLGNPCIRDKYLPTLSPNIEILNSKTELVKQTLSNMKKQLALTPFPQKTDIEDEVKQQTINELFEHKILNTYVAAGKDKPVYIIDLTQIEKVKDENKQKLYLETLGFGKDTTYDKLNLLVHAISCEKQAQGIENLMNTYKTDAILSTSNITMQNAILFNGRYCGFVFDSDNTSILEISAQDIYSGGHKKRSQIGQFLNQSISKCDSDFMDIVDKLKTKNMAKKIENASKYIEEIDSHKKSIFEFWKYSNKDEMEVLPEGEQEEVNVIKKIEKTFNYEEDLEEFGKKIDKMQRRNLDREDTDSVFIATTNLISTLNKIKTNNIMPEEIEKTLKDLKAEAKELKSLNEEEYDIFGNIIQDTTKVRKINNKRHRELPKDKFNILEVNKNTKQIGFKLVLQSIVQNITKALDKGIIPESLPVYKAINGELLNNKEINIFNINPEKEMQEAVKVDGDKINLYKIHINDFKYIL